MGGHNLTTEFLLDQCARYPALRPEDLLKALHQSVFGCGHFVTDTAAGMRRLREELSAETASDGPGVEPLDGDFCRVHLRYLEKSGLAPETLFRAFALSAESPCGSARELEEKLAVLLTLAQEERLPFSAEETAATVNAWRAKGFSACRHSSEFRAAYAPAYRVVRRELAWALPLLAAIDQKTVEQARMIVAIEGGSASGKTTLSAVLRRIYDCNVFHMDDFFLRSEQRTEARLAEPGGNVDRERFYEEVLLPLTKGQAVQYRRYDCGTQMVDAPREIPPKALNIVEGAYSMHPLLSECYDLSVCLRISPDLQRDRVLRRNGPEVAEHFFTQWIPLEQRYFAAMDPAGRCDLILEVER